MKLRVVLTEKACHFVDQEKLDVTVYNDKDEWVQDTWKFNLAVNDMFYCLA